MNAVEKFARLFAGRTDAYGTDDGGCWRNTLNTEPTLIIERHLDGSCPIGVYPIVVTTTDRHGPFVVRWGCVDFDIRSDSHPSYDFETEDEAHVAARDLKRVLAALGITAWIERTRSHGRHVWVFAKRPVPAATMRRALLVACALADVPTREVNPKQERLDEGQLGNYVRLPYPGGADATERQVLLRSDCTMGFEWFVREAYERRTDREILAKIAEHWQEPERAPIEVREWDGALSEAVRELEAPAYVVFRDGPATGDRSAGLWYVAQGCKRSGLTPEVAYAVVVDADSRWGKHCSRGERGLEELRRMVGRAYA